MEAPVTAAALLERAADPAAPSPFDARPYLWFDAREALPKPAAERVAAWLARLPCPALALAAEGADGVLVRAADAVVSREDEAALILRNIAANPVTAAVFVQTLRLTAALPVDEALRVESLAYSTLQGGAEFRRWLEGNRAAAPAVPTDNGPAVEIGRDGDVLSLTLNRASNRNSLNVEMRDALVEAFQLVLADDSIRQVRLSGRGKCFSVGGDLTEFGTLPDPATAHAIRQLAMPGRFLAACAPRVHAHVHGACIGSGVELPAFAAHVTAGADAWFHLPELAYGLIPGGGGCVGIPRRIGRQRTAWMVLSGRRVKAQQALEWGLVDAVSG
jgi:enoyl-CoA hydratase